MWTSVNLDYISKYGEVIGLDFSKDAMNFCKKRTRNSLILADAENLPIYDGTFDLIISLDVIEHLNNEAALSEFHRILKPNGFLIVTVPAFKFLWSKHDEVLHYQRRYSKRDLENKIQNNFSIHMMSYWNFFLFIPIAAVRVINKIRRTPPEKYDVKRLPALINYALIQLIKLENFLISHKISLPFGISLI